MKTTITKIALVAKIALEFAEINNFNGLECVKELSVRENSTEVIKNKVFYRLQHLNEIEANKLIPFAKLSREESLNKKFSIHSINFLNKLLEINLPEKISIKRNELDLSIFNKIIE